MSDAQVRDEVMTIFLAGHDTTAGALAWTWHLLSQHPEVEARWHAELSRLDGPPRMRDVPELPLTRAILAESMRLFPPAWAVGRQARHDVDLRGHRIGRGTVVQACQWLLHRDARWFAEPDRFLPERWTPELERALPRATYIPFGLGPRQCIGEAFAWLAATMALASIGKTWRLRPVPGVVVRPLPRITLRPVGLRLRAERR